MPTVVSPVKTPAPPYDPLERLAEAIGSMFSGTVGKKQAAAGTVSFQVTKALHRVLDTSTLQSRGTRLLLIRHLVDIESQAAGIEVSKTLVGANDLISTAQAAEILGYSRPYVAMLIDQNKLKRATVSVGGHRRVFRAAVLEWKDKHLVSGKATDLRTEGQKIGAKSTIAVVPDDSALASWPLLQVADPPRCIGKAFVSRPKLNASA